LENSWKAPRELTLSVPRVVGASKYFKLTFTIWTSVFAFMAALMIIIGGGISYIEYHKLEILKERGIKIEGVVVDLFRRRGGYEIAYRFSPSGISEAQSSGLSSDYCQRGICQNTSPIDENDYKKLAIGAKVPVIYSPEISYEGYLYFRDGFQVNPSGGLIPLAIMLCIIVALYAALMGFIQLLPYYRDKHLIKWGRATEATITETQGVNGSIKAVYQFMDADGYILEGVQYVYPSSLQSRYWWWPPSYLPAGDNLDNPTVVYDPRNSAKNLLYPSCWAVCYPPR
jgi:hypothetical protein